MGLGIVSLSDVQTDPATWRPFSYQQRLAEIASYRFFAGWLGLPMVLARAGRIGPRDASPRDPRLSIAETLDLLLRLRGEESVTWDGRFRTPLRGAEPNPRPFGELPIWVAVGGTPSSAVRAASSDCP